MKNHCYWRRILAVFTMVLATSAFAEGTKPTVPPVEKPDEDNLICYQNKITGRYETMNREANKDWVVMHEGACTECEGKTTDDCEEEDEEA